MIDRLAELKDYMYYFQFTITPYGKDIEPNLPPKNSELITAFKRISEILGSDRVIWRYDPILINSKYTMNCHIKAFNKIAQELHNHTRKVTISFIDEDYRVVKSNIKELALLSFPIEKQIELSSTLAKIAHSYNLIIDTCAEKIDLNEYGIEHARCIDDKLFEKLLGCTLNVVKDKNQRLECACKTSIDIGMYNTCKNGCRYCYANYNQKAVSGNYERHDPLSPLLTGKIGNEDKIIDRIHVFAIKALWDTEP